MVDVSSLTKDGFIGTSTYEGGKVEVGFDDSDGGVVLTPEMARRLRVRKGSKLLLTLEDSTTQVVELTVAGFGKKPRISDPKVYYAIGREGGGIMRLRSA